MQYKISVKFRVISILTWILLGSFLNFAFAQIPAESEIFTEDKITLQELKILPELRARVRSLLTQDYMFENRYLVRSLRASNHDLNAAEVMIQNTYKWRKQFNADNIVLKNFTSWYKTNPFKLVQDKSGRPGLISGFKALDLRKIILSGKVDELREYVIVLLDKSVVNIDRVSKLYGKEFSSGYLLFDANGYSARKFACLACIPIWIEFATSTEMHYPHLGHNIIVINLPGIFQNLFLVIKPILSQRTQSIAQLYGFDRSEWLPVLLKFFDKSQLTTEFVGTGTWDIRFLNKDFFGSNETTISTN